MEHRRIATWWITWEDLNWPDVDSMEKVKSRAEGLAKANVNTVMLFGTHFRWDWMPFFPLLHNYIAAIVNECHKYGIKVFDHHSVNLVHRYSTQEEMIHVMRDSGPHLPFSPTWEAAASWQYKGKYLNDWRMMDVKDGKPLYLPQYTAEGFCPRNPEFKEAYFDYVKYLISETGIDGLSADDAMYYARNNACACKYCRAELKRRAGIDLPPVDDLSFWGNWDNPAWKHWIDLRFDASGEFYQELGKIVPEGFVLTGCGGSSAGAGATFTATDARHFLRGANYVNLELSGNTPPYKHDPKTVNVPLRDRLSNSSHHQAAAKEKGVRAFSNAYCFTTQTANIAWSLCKILDADAWLGTLKARLGLPRHILATLPEEKDIVGQAFTFEKEHPQLFRGDFIGQLAVYFSYETRNHTLYGSLQQGYAKDFSSALALLCREGICPHTVFEIPKEPSKYPVLVLSGVSSMTADELAAVEAYMAAGGKVIAVGPSCVPGCQNNWQLSNQANIGPDKFFSYVLPGEAWMQIGDWEKQPVASSDDENIWQQPTQNLFYNPQRLSDGNNNEDFLALCRKYMSPMPISVVSAKGYLCTMFETEDQITVHFLAEDYDVDVDHQLDSIRFHRSRVNLITKAEPIGTDGVLRFNCTATPSVYTPFHAEGATVVQQGSECTITLPDNCFYAIAQFQK